MTTMNPEVSSPAEVPRIVGSIEELEALFATTETMKPSEQKEAAEAMLGRHTMLDGRPLRIGTPGKDASDGTKRSYTISADGIGFEPGQKTPNIRIATLGYRDILPASSQEDTESSKTLVGGLIQCYLRLQRRFSGVEERVGTTAAGTLDIETLRAAEKAMLDYVKALTVNPEAKVTDDQAWAVGVFVGGSADYDRTHDVLTAAKRISDWLRDKAADLK